MGSDARTGEMWSFSSPFVALWWQAFGLNGRFVVNVFGI